jgi:hypothetical protein
MNGTIAHIQIKPGAEAELDRIGREHTSQIAGLVFEHVYRIR